MAEAQPHLYLIDGSGYIFRAYFGLPMMNRPDGTPVNAVFGFSSMLMGLLEGNQANYLTVIFDAARRNFRNDFYPDYKGHRPETPEDLIPQFALIREAVEAFNVPSMELDGYEADDLIAAYAKAGIAAGMRVTVVSSDKDLMQLVKEGVELWDPVKNKIIDSAGVVEKFGVTPDKVVDVQALAGDSADNVPGVPGIGVKTAAELINLYGNLENLLAHAEEIKQPKRRQSLIDFAEQARISQRLVTLDENAPMPLSLEQLARQKLDHNRLQDFFEVQGFRRLMSRLGGGGRDPSMKASVKPIVNPKLHEANLADGVEAETNADQDHKLELSSTLAALKSIPFGGYELVTSKEQLLAWRDKILLKGYVAVDTETTGLHIHDDHLVGISLAVEAGEACYIPLAHQKEVKADLFADEQPRMPTINQLDHATVFEVLKPIFTDSGILKIGQNLKFDISIFAQSGAKVTPLDDTMLLSFVLEGGLGGHGMDSLSKKHLEHTPISFDSVTGKGNKRISFAEVDLDAACAYAAEDADVTLRLWLALKPQLQKARLVHFYESVERPLVNVLAEMEREGIKVNLARLKQLDLEFGELMKGLEAEIYALAGESFNIASPKQMGEILFEKLKLPSSNKTGGGALSTNVAVLEPLADEYPIAAKILEWRTLAKLRSTYCDALIAAANPVNHRVHTSFSMVGAQTGRLSSSDPNLQNIPVRTKEGRMIRSAFICEEGMKLVSLDYSQIELRLLAEMAEIESLRQAFHDGLDIHAATAAEVFGLKLKDVTPDIRRKAKAINFGIVYGISAFGLAKQIHVSNQEAKEYISSYFQKFPGIRAFMDHTIHQCQLNGYVETMFGRRIHIPSIFDPNKGRAQGAQRQAINAPIQGSAADVIKRAMNRVPAALRQTFGEGYQSRVKMLLQVHDELLFEIKTEDLDLATKLIKDVMENAAAPVVKMHIPLKVECGISDNWSDAH